MLDQIILTTPHIHELHQGAIAEELSDLLHLNELDSNVFAQWGQLSRLGQACSQKEQQSRGLPVLHTHRVLPPRWYTWERLGFLVSPTRPAVRVSLRLLAACPYVPYAITHEGRCASTLTKVSAATVYLMC